MDENVTSRFLIMLYIHNTTAKSLMSLLMKEKKEETKNENQPWKKQQMPIPLLMEKKC